ncbi:MAG: hypothetical protein AAF717_12980 [Bacteroidota bacterium]
MKIKKALLACTFLVTLSIFGQATNTDLDKDRKVLIKAIEDYNKAWDTADVDLAIANYSTNIYWVNSVGDVIRNRTKLQDYLSFIFKLDFVMEAKRLPQLDEITYLDDDIGIVQSVHLESGAKNFHLRVFQKQGDNWKIINHLTSKEHPKE